MQTNNDTFKVQMIRPVASPAVGPYYAAPGPGVGTGRQAGFRFQCPRGVRVRLPPWAPQTAAPGW